MMFFKLIIKCETDYNTGLSKAWYEAHTTCILAMKFLPVQRLVR